MASKWIYTVLKIFSSFTTFEQLALTLKKQSCPEIFHCIEYTFYIKDFEQLALALKNRVSLKYSTVWNIFLHSKFWASCACPEKQSGPGIFTVLNMYFLSLRILEQLALALKSRGCPKFTVLNMYFLFSGFLSKLHLPWKTELPWNFKCIEYVFLIIQDFWATCACPEKQSLPWKFSLYWIYFLH